MAASRHGLRYLPGIESLERRELLSTYSLSSGVLKETTGGRTVAILRDVTAFAVDASGDVLALRTDRSLQERPVGTSTWNIFGRDVTFFGLDGLRTTAFAANSSGVLKASTTATGSNGYGNWISAGHAPVQAADHSLWFTGTTYLGGPAGYEIFRLAKQRVTQMPGMANTLGAAEDTVWAFTRGQQDFVSRWDGTAWQLQPRATVSPDGIWFLGVKRLDDYGNLAIYRFLDVGYTGGDGLVHRMPGKATRLTSSGITTWNMSASHAVAHWDGTTWVRQTSIVVGADRFFMDPTQDASFQEHPIYRWVDNQLGAPSTYANFLGRTDGVLWTNTFYDSNRVFRWNGASWTEWVGVRTPEDGWYLGTPSVNVAGDHFVYRMHAGLLSRTKAAASFLLPDYRNGVVAVTAANRVLGWNGSGWYTSGITRSPAGSQFTLANRRLFRFGAGSAPGQWKIFNWNEVDAFTVGTDGTVFAAYSSNIYRADAETVDGSGVGTWSLLGTQTITAPDGSMWFLGWQRGANNRYPIYRLVSGIGITLMPGSALQLGVVEGAVWAIGVSQDQPVARWTGKAWQPVGSTYASDGYWFLGAGDVDGKGNHPIYRVRSGDTAIERMPGQAVRMSALNYSTTAALSQDVAGNVFRWDGSQWSKETSVRSGSTLLVLDSLDSLGSNHLVFRWVDSLSVLTTRSVVSLVSAGGDAYGVDDANRVFRWSAGNWTDWLGTAAPDGGVWLLTTADADGKGNHAVYRVASGTIKRMPGLFSSLTGGSGWYYGGGLWGANTRNQVMRWTGSEWVRQSTVKGPDGTPWFLGLEPASDGGPMAVFRVWEGILGRMPAEATGLAVVESVLWAFSRSYGYYARYWDGADWITSPAVFDKDGVLWFLGKDDVGSGNHAVYRWVNGIVTRVTGAFDQLASAAGAIWSLDAAGKVWQWNGTSWDQRGSGMKSLAGGASYTNPFATDSAGQVLRYQSGNWNVIATGAQLAGDGSAWFMDFTASPYFGNYPLLRLRNGEVDSPGAGIGFAVVDGRVWRVDADRAVWRYELGAWYGISGRNVLTAPDGTWFLPRVDQPESADLLIYRIQGTQLTKMPGVAAALVGVTENAVWAMNSAGKVLRWNGAAWNERPTAVFKNNGLIAGTWTVGETDADGHGNHYLYWINSNKELKQSSGMHAVTLVSSPSQLTLMAVDAYGQQAYYLSGYTLSGNVVSDTWATVNTQVSGDGSLFFWKAGTSAPIYRWKSGRLTPSLTNPTGLASTEGAVWAADTSQRVWRWTGKTWSKQASAYVSATGLLWFLGQASANAAGDHAIYAWNGSQLSAMGGAGIALWTASNTVWHVDKGNRLYAWINGGWVLQTTATAAADGSYQVSDGANHSVKVLGLTQDKLGEGLGSAMPYIIDLESVALFGPKSKIGESIINKYVAQGTTLLKNKLLTALADAYASGNPGDFAGNGYWGHTNTRQIWDGFNRDGSSHYRSISYKDGWWTRSGVDAPVLSSFDLVFESFDPATKQWNFRLDAVIDTRVWMEAQLWSWGAQLFNSSLAGNFRSTLSLNIAVIPKLTYDTVTGRATVELATNISTNSVSNVLSFGNTAPGDRLANAMAVQINLLLALAQVIEASTLNRAASYFDYYKFILGYVSDPYGLVRLQMYFLGSLAETRIVER